MRFVTSFEAVYGAVSLAGAADELSFLSLLLAGLLSRVVTPSSVYSATGPVSHAVRGIFLTD